MTGTGGLKGRDKDKRGQWDFCGVKPEKKDYVNRTSKKRRGCRTG